MCLYSGLFSIGSLLRKFVVYVGVTNNRRIFQFVREEALLELSSFHENNKILIESKVKGGYANPTVKTHYEQLISSMTRWVRDELFNCGNINNTYNLFRIYHTVALKFYLFMWKTI